MKYHSKPWEEFGSFPEKPSEDSRSEGKTSWEVKATPGPFISYLPCQGERGALPTECPHAKEPPSNGACSLRSCFHAFNLYCPVHKEVMPGAQAAP